MDYSDENPFSSGTILRESHKLLVSMLEAVCVGHKEAKAIVAIQLKPAFRAAFQVATTREGSGVILIKEPPDQAQKAPSPRLWGKRGSRFADRRRGPWARRTWAFSRDSRPGAR